MLQASPILYLGAGGLIECQGNKRCRSIIFWVILPCICCVSTGESQLRAPDPGVLVLLGKGSHILGCWCVLNEDVGL